MKLKASTKPNTHRGRAPHLRREVFAPRRRSAHEDLTRHAGEGAGDVVFPQPNYRGPGELTVGIAVHRNAQKSEVPGSAHLQRVRSVERSLRVVGDQLREPPDAPLNAGAVDGSFNDDLGRGHLAGGELLVQDEETLLHLQVVWQRAHAVEAEANVKERNCQDDHQSSREYEADDRAAHHDMSHPGPRTRLSGPPHRLPGLSS